MSSGDRGDVIRYAAEQPAHESRPRRRTSRWPKLKAPQRPRRRIRAWKFIERKPLTAGRAARIIALATIAVTLGSGVLIRFADHKNFSDIGQGLWWAVQTVTTVGYGDLVPTNTFGRLVASVVMITGIGFLTVITATITSKLIEQARRRVEGSTTDELATKLDQIIERLDLMAAGASDAQQTRSLTIDQHERT